jgi:class 3 adenylate cyclase
MTVDPLEALRAQVDALTARVEHLTRLVESLAGSQATVDTAEGSSPDDDVWRRLGLVEGERRTVTVLFADVSGFTALSETLDPEAMQLVMRDTMSVLAECVQAEGGTLEKFIGDALCAIFGAPVAHPDEPDRAARAAIAMHERLSERAVSRPDLPPLGVHVGINTGPVIAGAVGDGSQFGVMGDTINTAARLMGLAGDGQTFVSSTTARRLRRWFRLEDAGLHEVKGKAEPLAVSSLVGVLTAGEREELRRLRSPFVGREGELATVRRLAARVADGDGIVVLVVGEPGMGTSRVAAEAAESLEAQGWQVLRASARVHSETPLGLVASALGPLVEQAAATGTPVDPQLAEALLGTGGTSAPHDFELALGELVAEASGSSPLLVVLDDLDTADPGSVEVIRYLTRVTTHQRVLWLCTGEHIPGAFDPTIGTDDAVVVRVGPLADVAVEEMLDTLLPGALDPSHRSRLAHLAEGNPQFVVEIALALVDDGVVQASGEGAWVLVGDPDHLALPGSVAELIEARIDQLPTRARITLQDAAVIGQRFSEALLARVATIPTSVDAGLAELADAELVVPPDAGSDEPGLWSFRSRLVREVAYDSLLRRRRPPAHRAVAEALLELEPEKRDENADLLAHHFEASDDPPLAMDHLVEAVERAEAAYNFTGALERARRAVRLRDRFPDRVDDRLTAHLFQRMGILQLVLGDESGLADLEQAAALLERVGTAAERVSLRERVGWYLTIAGRRDAAVPYLQDAQALAESDLDGLAQTGALAAIATTRAFAVAAGGDLLTGMAAVEGAAQEARDAGDPFGECRALLVGGVCLLWAGQPAESVEQLQASLELAWANVYGTLADRCGRWLVLALVEAGRYETALELAEPLLARSDDRGDPSVGCGVRAALANLWRQVGDFSHARHLALAAVKASEERHVATDAAAEAHLLLCRVAQEEAAGAGAEALAAAAEEAERHLAAVEALAAADTWLAWRWRSRVHLVRGRLALAGGDVEAALLEATNARLELGRAPARLELLAADRLEGQALAAGQNPGAAAILDRAVAAATATGSPYLVAVTAGEAAAALADLDPVAAAHADALAAEARQALQAWRDGTTVAP